MKQNLRCYSCIYCQICNKEQEQKCANEYYILFTTEEQAKMCELMCGEVQEDSYG